MMIKDWKKWKWSSRKSYYSWYDTKEEILNHAVAVLYESKKWTLQIYKNRKEKLTHFKTKTEAMKSAKKYMRSH